MVKQYKTKDSGKREVSSTGYHRDVQENKPRFDLVIPKEQPYEEQLLTRIASLMGRGAIKYGDRNWEVAELPEELERAKASAFRHFMQWFCGMEDEDHAAAVFFNIQVVEYVKWRLNK